jgi:hypothetical protein
VERFLKILADFADFQWKKSRKGISSPDCSGILFSRLGFVMAEKDCGKQDCTSKDALNILLFKFYKICNKIPIFAH